MSAPAFEDRGPQGTMLPRGDTRPGRWKRRVLLTALGTVFVAGLLFVGGSCNCPVIVSLGPYDSMGIWKTTDVEGNECLVEVLCKVRSLRVPPGEHPRIKVICTSGDATSMLVHDTDWRYGPGWVQPVPGGIDVFASGLPNQGAQFRISKGRVRKL